MDIRKLEKEIYKLEKESGERLSKEDIRAVINEVKEYDPDLLCLLTEKCVGCGEYFYRIAHDHKYMEYYPTDDGILCGPCYEYEITEPPAIALIRNHNNGYDGFEDDEGNMRCIIGHYVNQTNGDFEVEWHSMGGWRGYYGIKANNGWKHVHDDAILSCSEDEKELKKFDEDLEEFCDNRGIPLAKVFSRTSNVLCSGYDIFVLEEDLELVEKFIEIAKRTYRDDRRFAITALTGKDPERFDEGDNLLLEAYERIKAGEDFEDVKAEILKKAAGGEIPIPA